MNWVLLVLFFYTLIGSILASRTIRGLHVQAKLFEWIVLIFFWPFSLRFYAQMAIIQSMIQNMEYLEDHQDQDGQN